MPGFSKFSPIPPPEYFTDMAEECMEKYRHYLRLSQQLPDHQHLLIQVCALFCFASRAFTDFGVFGNIENIGNTEKQYELDRISRYIVKTELAEFVIACYFVICYASEEGMLKIWGRVDIRDDLYQKFRAIESLSREFQVITSSVSIEHREQIDVRTCSVETLEYLIKVATKFASQDGCGFFNVA